ncbi:hypothetical protein [Acidiplasma aeolicum]|jgi:hypothetical protein|uniref:hypothetical protein n=1 Tax=Acidiplasma aeolicum TaxID=507754 RepID=UPI00371B3283
MKGKQKAIISAVIAIIVILSGIYYLTVDESHFGFPDSGDAGHIVGSKLNETKIETSGPGINFIKSEHVEYYNTSSKNMVLNITEFEDNSSEIAHNSYIYEIHLYNVTYGYKIIKSNATLKGFKYTEFYSIGDILSIGEKGNMQFIINLYLTNNTYYLKPGIYTMEINGVSNITINQMAKSPF